MLFFFNCLNTFYQTLLCLQVQLVENVVYMEDDIVPEVVYQLYRSEYSYLLTNVEANACSANSKTGISHAGLFTHENLAYLAKTEPSLPEFHPICLPAPSLNRNGQSLHDILNSPCILIKCPRGVK